MIDKRLLDKNYYKKKLPAYMRDSFGIQDQFNILSDLLCVLDDTYDNIMKMYNIFDDDYLDWINSLEGNEDGTVSDILDMIGYLYGVTRTFDCTYINEYFEDEDHKRGMSYTEPLTLNNSEFLKLIKARLIQNNFDGTYIQTREFYDNIDLPLVIFHNAASASALIYLYATKDQVDFTDNELKMYMAGLFTIKSMGITYEYRVGDVVNILIWSNSTRLWDCGEWS